MTDKDRDSVKADFEKWADDKLDLDTTQNGEYATWSTRMAYEAWQTAARKAAREEREWAMADDFATIARALESARGWVPERTEDNLLSLIGEALSALDRLAGKLSGTA